MSLGHLTELVCCEPRNWYYATQQQERNAVHLQVTCDWPVALGGIPREYEPVALGMEGGAWERLDTTTQGTVYGTVLGPALLEVCWGC